MIRSDATFDGTFPFAPHFDDASGFRMHYVDEGPHDGETLLCLHGEPTWGYLFRHLIAALARRIASSSPIIWASAKARRRRTAATGCRTMSTTWSASCSRAVSIASRS